MTAVRLTVAEARRLGLLTDATEPDPDPSTTTPPRRRRAPYLTRCHACGEEQRSEAAQSRHRQTTGHRRYEIPPGRDPMSFRRIRSGDYWRYQLDGRRLLGVTTLIGKGVPKPALVGWSARLAAEYAADNIDTIARLEREAAVELIKGAANRSRNTAAVKGKTIHGFAERLVAGDQVDVPDELAGYVDAYMRFLEEWQPEPLAVEAAVCSRRWRYAGTFDLLARLGDQTAIVDVKTGDSGVWPETCLQLAAYRHAETMLNADGVEVTMPQTDAGYALWLGPGGGYELLTVQSDDAMFAVFLHACHVAGFAELDRETLIGAALPVPGVEVPA